MTLELVGVTKRFGAQVALDHVSLKVEDGDCYGFIGHNGAGKTTAMRIALGLQRADEGRVIVAGFDAAKFPREARARMGGLIEVPGFQGGWSGTKNLAELARLQGMTRADARREAARWVERVGLAGAGAKHVANYSQGMRQRLGIAQALLGSPEYVLLDEPTNGLDPEGIAEMRELIQSLRAEGRTFLVSSHQLHELATICNRVGVLRGGKLLLQGPTSELLSGGTRWRLETTDVRAAEDALVKMGVSRSANTPGGDVKGAMWLDLGARKSAEITRGLVERGVDVVSFAPSQTTLEEIYLRFAHGAGAEQRPATKVEDVAQRTSSTPKERIAPKRPVVRMASFDLRRYAGSIGLVLLFLSPVVVAALRVLHRSSQASANQADIEAGKLFSSTSVNGFEALGLALQSGLPVLAFLILGLASQSLAAEYARGTLRNVLLRPLKRIECALGKGLALLSVTYVAYALLVAISYALVASLFQFADLAEVLPNGQKFMLTPASEMWGPLRIALLAPLPGLAAYAGLGFLAGAIARTSAGALSIALGLGVVLDLARVFTRPMGLAGALPSDHLPSPLSDTSYLSYYVDLVTNVSNVRFDHPLAAVLVPLAWALVAFASATLLLRRRAIP
jgi:ABC-2 type transport system ATP-binding protein